MMMIVVIVMKNLNQHTVKGKAYCFSIGRAPMQKYRFEVFQSLNPCYSLSSFSLIQKSLRGYPSFRHNTDVCNV